MAYFQDILALALAVAATAFVARYVWRAISGKSACDCGHRPIDGGGCAAQQPGNRIKRTPIVPVGNVGTPRNTTKLS